MLQPDLSEFEIPTEEAERRISGQQEQAKRKAHPEKWYLKLPIRQVINQRNPLPPQTRIWLWLLFKTKSGQRSVLFTTEDAEMLGVAHNKMRDLRRLEARGLIKLTTRGTATVIVTVVMEDESEVAQTETQIDYWLARPKRIVKPG